jgi:HTH-type transcriptional regulator, glycine betaine synthesis regulator
MPDELDKAREDLIQEVGRLSSFAGFNKAMGQIYALLYLSKEPVSLTEIAQQLGISKGNASLNIQTMERWGLVHPINKKGDRRDYYQAETDFWKIVRDIVNERDRKEIDHTISSIAAILTSVDGSGNGEDSPEKRFYRERLGQMLEFGNAINQIIQASLTLQNFRQNILKRPGPEADLSTRIEVED